MDLKNSYLFLNIDNNNQYIIFIDDFLLINVLLVNEKDKKYIKENENGFVEYFSNNTFIKFFKNEVKIKIEDENKVLLFNENQNFNLIGTYIKKNKKDIDKLITKIHLKLNNTYKYDLMEIKNDLKIKILDRKCLNYFWFESYLFFYKENEFLIKSLNNNINSYYNINILNNKIEYFDNNKCKIHEGNINYLYNYLTNIQDDINIDLNNLISNKDFELNNKVDIIVSKYNENINWLLKYNLHKNSYIYVKNTNYDNNLSFVKKYEDIFKKIIFLENKGKEGQTFLYHIINNYHNLADINYFIQANPFDHVNIIDIIYKNNNDLKEERIMDVYYGYHISIIQNYKCIYDENMNIKELLKKIFDYNFDNIIYNFLFCSGATLCLKKEQILKRPKEFYIKCYNLLSNEINPYDGYIFERIWGLIFGTDIPSKI